MARRNVRRQANAAVGEFPIDENIKRRLLCPAPCRAVNKYKKYMSPGIANSKLPDADLITCWRCNNIIADGTFGYVDPETGSIKWLTKSGMAPYSKIEYNPDSVDDSSADENEEDAWGSQEGPAE